MRTAHFDVQRIHSAPETERIQSHTHQLMQKKKLVQSLIFEIAAIVDVLGIQMQVPSLSSPGYSVWILIGRGHEIFVNEIHCLKSDIVKHSSSLHAKDNYVYLESSKPTVVNHE